MTCRVVTKLSITALLATLMTACVPPGGTAGPITCTIPCIDSAPTATPTSVSSSTGGTVIISFHINGNIADVSYIHILLHSTNAYSSNVIYDLSNSGVITNPSSNSITYNYVIGASETPDTYYPDITINTTSGDSGFYYISPAISTTEYTYFEIVDSSSSEAQHSDMSIPQIVVQ